MVVFSSQPVSPFRLLLVNSLHAGTASGSGGVRISDVVEYPSPAQRRYEPGHPDADENGYVAYPAINAVQEMVDLMGSERAYELKRAWSRPPSR